VANIRKSDRVMVIAGTERGKEGKVIQVFPKKNRVIIQGINFVKRHTKPRGQTQPGGIIEKEAPIHISNVMLICNKCNKTTKIAKRIMPDGNRVRLCKKCGEII